MHKTSFWFYLKKYLPHFIVAWSASTCIASYALVCVSIEGNNSTVDAQGAFKDDGWLVNPKVAGVPCVRANTWAEARTKVESLKKEGKIKKGERLFVEQSSHGGPGGTAYVNGMWFFPDSPHYILDTLESWGKEFQVGAEIRSCFSGDLQKLKLERDELRDNSDEDDGSDAYLGNVCLITASDFGRLASLTNTTDGAMSKNYQTENLSNPTGKSLEEYFLASKLGTISSAPWSTARVSEYLLHHTASLAGEALGGMVSLLAPNGNCPNNLPLAAKLLCLEGMNDALYEKLVNLKQAPDLEETWSKQITEAYKRLKDLDPTSSASSSSLTDEEKLAALCITDLEKLGVTQGQRGSTYGIEYLIYQINEVKSRYPEKFRNCAQLIQLRKSAAGSGANSNNDISYLFLTKNSDFDKRVKNYFAARTELIHEITRNNGKPKEGASQIHDLIETLAKSGEDRLKKGASCGNSSQAKLAKHAFGDAFYKNEYGYHGYPDTYIDENSAANITSAFTRVGLSVPDDKLTSWADKQRREACRDFKLDGK